MQVQRDGRGLTITLEGGREIEALALACSDIAEKLSPGERSDLFANLGTAALWRGTVGSEPRSMRLEPPDSQVAMEALAAWSSDALVNRATHSKHYLRSMKTGGILSALAGA